MLREAQANTQQRSKLGQIGSAMHNYAGTHGAKLPRAANAGPDKPGQLSWRVALLPFLEEEALYREFHLDEPWDSPHNLTLLPRMPEVYRSARKHREPYHTYFQVITGTGGVFRDNRAPLLPRDFNPRGTSNIILIAEAPEAVPWTKPADLVFDKGGPLPKFGGMNRNGFLVVMGDCSLRIIPREGFPEDRLRAALVPDSDSNLSLGD
jgi:hypothetical protein